MLTSLFCAIFNTRSAKSSVAAKIAVGGLGKSNNSWTCLSGSRGGKTGNLIYSSGNTKPFSIKVLRYPSRRISSGLSVYSGVTLSPTYAQRECPFWIKCSAAMRPPSALSISKLEKFGMWFSTNKIGISLCCRRLSAKESIGSETIINPSTCFEYGSTV